MLEGDAKEGEQVLLNPTGKMQVCVEPLGLLASQFSLMLYLALGTGISTEFLSN